MDAPNMQAFRIVAQAGAARRCVYRGVDTPVIAHFTRGAQVPHVQPGLAVDHGVRCAAVSIGDVVQLRDALAGSSMTLAEACRTGSEVLQIITGRQPLEEPLNSNADDSTTIEVPGGRVKVTIAEYNEALAALKPHVAVAVADEVLPSAGRKRQTKALKRTERWLADATAAARLGGWAVLAPVVGGPYPDLRRESAAAASAHASDVDGFVILGLGLGESPQEQGAALTAALSALPAERHVRVACAGGAPAQVLRLVLRGVDVVQSSYAYELSREGVAATFDFDAASTPALAATLNLRDAACKLDQRPIVPGCPCYTCRHHTRAYLYHLLDRHEMLAPTLLQLHNTWHMNAFLARVRAEVERGTVHAFAATHGVQVQVDPPAAADDAGGQGRQGLQAIESDAPMPAHGRAADGSP